MKTLLAFVGLVVLSGCQTSSPTAVAKQEPASPVVVTHGSLAGSSFAQVSMTLEGCTSCAPCRSTIRQVVQATSHADQTAFGEGYTSATMTYAAPRDIPVQNVYNNLLSSALKDVTIPNVVVDATGVLERSGDATFFVVSETHQRFPARVGALDETLYGRNVRIKAVVQGLESGTVTLEVQELTVP